MDLLRNPHLPDAVVLSDCRILCATGPGKKGINFVCWKPIQADRHPLCRGLVDSVSAVYHDMDLGEESLGAESGGGATTPCGPLPRGFRSGLQGKDGRRGLLPPSSLVSCLSSILLCHCRVLLLSCEVCSSVGRQVSECDEPLRHALQSSCHGRVGARLDPCPHALSDEGMERDYDAGAPDSANALGRVGLLLFFGLGWMLHTQAGRLDRVFGSWRAHLSLGLMLSIGLYVSVEHLQVTQVAPVRGLLVNDDLNDWPVLRESLLANAGDSAEINAAHQVWMLFPEGARDYVENKEMLTPDEKTGLVQQLNKILMVESLLSINASTSEAELEAMMGQSSLDAIEKNRAALVASLKGVAPLQAGPSRVLKMAYSFGYSLTTILFVFGIMGGFQSLCRHHSPAWRYVADASYWIYLVHMPLLPAIEIVMFRWDMTAWVKIPLLCGTSLVLLFLSYHYLVRSSFIGKILNGRRYPFFANPFKAVWKKASGSPASNDVACHRSP